MVTSVIELADKLYKASKGKVYGDVAFTKTRTLAHICANANDLGLPLSVVQQLLKGTDYEQLI